MTNINNQTPSSPWPLFNLGFRPFFLGAAIFSIISMVLWSLIISYDFVIPLGVITSSQWHAHEMIYGYTLAVIAGFLLTAVKNWTGIQTTYGWSLLSLFLLWLIARILFLFGTTFIQIAAVFDLLFMIFLTLSIALPIIKAKNWRQILILVNLLLFTMGNLCFYLHIFNLMDNGIDLALYGGLYLIIGLILIIGRRVIPFFIERGVEYDVKLFNSPWIDIPNLVLFIALLISDLFIKHDLWTSSLALSLFFITSIRLTGWYAVGIWKKPLLWSLYLAVFCINIGFLLLALTSIMSISKSLAIHAFAFGGIGIITIGMMSRVALGHTGRNIHTPPRTVSVSLLLLILGVLFRVGLPLVDTTHYLLWIKLSQALWIAAFAIFVFSYFPILTSPRIDNKFG